MAAHAATHANLIYVRPPFAGDEQAIARRVVGNAVQNRLRARTDDRVQPGQIDPLAHASRPQVDDGDSIRMPDVGVDVAANEFELIEALDRLTVVRDLDLSTLAM